jgi:excisionase family DNA binding protein
MIIAHWLRASAAAELIGCDRTTLWRWVREGVIPESALIIRGRSYRIARWWCEGGVAMQVSLKNVHPESQVRSA